MAFEPGDHRSGHSSMANSSGLNRWILQNVGPLGIQIERSKWISNLFPGVSDIAVSLQIGERSFHGWGIDASADIALNKAIAELFERFVMSENGFSNSNGMAAHITEKAAMDSAVKELVERDLFFCHFLTKTPFKKIEDFGIVPEPFSKWLNQNGIKVSFFCLGESGAICLIDGRKALNSFGFVMSLSLRDRLEESKLSSLLVAARSAHRIYSLPEEIGSISLEEFSRLERYDFHSHGRLARDVEYANQIAFLFEEEASSPGFELQIRPNARLIFPISQKFNNCPLFVARATCLEAQDVFLGYPSVERVNLERLRNFSRKEISFEDVNKLPHPLQ